MLKTHRNYLFTIGALLSVALSIAFFLFSKGANHIADTRQRYTYEFLKIKQNILQFKNGTRRVIVLSGSNAFYGFRANLFEKITGIPTINMAVQGSLGVNYMLYYVKPFLHRGDILILPIEYHVLFSKSVNNFVVTSVSYGFGLDYFKSLKLPDKIEYMRVFNKEHFIDSLMRGLGYRNSYKDLPLLAECINENGDMCCNKSNERIKKGLHKLLTPYREKTQRFIKTSGPLPHYIALDILVDFFGWAKKNGVIVIGTYPNTVDIATDRKIMEYVRNWYIQHNQIFIGEESESIFPESMMYDTIYHLNNKGAKLRTTLFAKRFCAETNYCEHPRRS
ncbi:hypothetical protein [Legionella brunensis]|uniref:Uncharacterized protein n=1 Tax=Legionella brunensis TaxID=29422 RepID=A0A0W0SE38_9GAMM|nr:hypothetical protein [Legionella brunensis]KTC81419.1 hypothetical protein Lbru_1939 [Legionella brunensis]